MEHVTKGLTSADDGDRGSTPCLLYEEITDPMLNYDDQLKVMND